MLLHCNFQEANPTYSAGKQNRELLKHRGTSPSCCTVQHCPKSFPRYSESLRKQSPTFGSRCRNHRGQKLWNHGMQKSKKQKQ